MEKFLKKLKNKENLNFNESKAAFEILMNGKASEDEMFNFLTLLIFSCKILFFFSEGFSYVFFNLIIL